MKRKPWKTATITACYALAAANVVLALMYKEYAVSIGGALIAILAAALIVND